MKDETSKNRLTAQCTAHTAAAASTVGSELRMQCWAEFEPCCGKLYSTNPDPDCTIAYSAQRQAPTAAVKMVNVPKYVAFTALLHLLGTDHDLCLVGLAGPVSFGCIAWRNRT